MRMRQVEITSPCHESWDAMNGGEERRFCGVCQKDVHNLSAMRHDEAEALLKERSGEQLCVRYTAESDGSLRFRDLVPSAGLTRKIVRAAFAATMLAACTPHADGPPIDNLGDAVIDSVRQDTVPTADGGCDYQTGPFTTVHLPPGHLLCKQSGSEVVQPPDVEMGKMPVERVKMGEAPMVVEPPKQPVVVDPVARTPIQGGITARPEPDSFVPCDPKPVVPPVQPNEGRELMGDVAMPEPEPPPLVHKLMGKPTLRPEKDDAEKMGKRVMTED